jgi:hypothetical protein
MTPCELILTSLIGFEYDLVLDESFDFSTPILDESKVSSLPRPNMDFPLALQVGSPILPEIASRDGSDYNAKLPPLPQNNSMIFSTGQIQTVQANGTPQSSNEPPSAISPSYSVLGRIAFSPTAIVRCSSVGSTAQVARGSSGTGPQPSHINPSTQEHQSLRVKCRACPKTFSRKDARNRHYKAAHENGAEKFYCQYPTCKRSLTGGNGFPRKEHLQNHMKTCIAHKQHVELQSEPEPQRRVSEPTDETRMERTASQSTDETAIELEPTKTEVTETAPEVEEDVVQRWLRHHQDSMKKLEATELECQTKRQQLETDKKELREKMQRQEEDERRCVEERLKLEKLGAYIHSLR